MTYRDIEEQLQVFQPYRWISNPTDYDSGPSSEDWLYNPDPLTEQADANIGRPPSFDRIEPTFLRVMKYGYRYFDFDSSYRPHERDGINAMLISRWAMDERDFIEHMPLLN